MSTVTIIKTKKEVATVIEWNGRRYVLDHAGGSVQGKGEKRNGKK